MNQFPRLRILFSCLTALCVVGCNSTDTVPPEWVGLSTERLARIDDAVQNHLDAKRVPGTVSLIARRGNIAYFQASGMRDLHSAAPMRKDTIFRIYSMTKPITSVGVMMLYEQGKFLLNDPVSKYLPELGGLKVLEKNMEKAGEATFTTVPAKRDMTVRDLLRHTSGLTYGFFGNAKVDQMYLEAGVLRTDKTIAETVAKLGKLPLKHQPGTTFEYSVSTDVLGRLIEVLSGMPLDEYFQQRIFKPLAMVDTAFWVPESKRDRFASMYSVGEDGSLGPVASTLARDYTKPTTHFSGGGGLVSTTTDYLRFCRMLLGGGKLGRTRLLSPTTIDLMTRNHLGDIPMGMGMTGSGFGLGFAVQLDPGISGSAGSVGTFGWGGAAGTVFWIDPQEDMIGIFMIQILPHTGDYRSQFRALAYQAVVD